MCRVVVRLFLNSLNVSLIFYVCFLAIGCVAPNDSGVPSEESPVIELKNPIGVSHGGSNVESQVLTSVPRTQGKRNSRLSGVFLPTVTPMPVAKVSSVVAVPPIEIFTVTPTAGIHSLVTLMIGDVRFEAEVADTPDERSKGLSGRDRLPHGKGMVFLFEDRQASTFWMGGMLFPLDFIWISRDCKVVDITPSVPTLPAGITGSQVPVYVSRAPASFVFEINAGEAQESGITVGDPVWFSGDGMVVSDCQSQP